MMNVIFNVVVEEMIEQDIPALKETIKDHILEMFPDTEVSVEEKARVES